MMHGGMARVTDNFPAGADATGGVSISPPVCDIMTGAGHDDNDTRT